MFKSINLKLGNAKKVQDYTIYPYNGNGVFTIQSSTRIAQVNMDGKGTVSNPHANGAYFPHLSFERNPIQLTASELMELKLIVLGEGELLNHNNCIFAEQNLTGITI
jgi:hypothetical protein